MFEDIYFRQNVHCQQATSHRERERGERECTKTLMINIL